MGADSRSVRTAKPRWHRLALALSAAVLLAVALSAALSASSSAAGPPAPVPVAVSVSATTVGRPLPQGFLGLSLEYRTVPAYSGTDPHASNPVFAQLLRNLVPHGHPVIRLGGQSTDRTWWPVPHMARPLGITYNLTPGWLADAQAMVKATGARLILGIGLEANRWKIASLEAHTLLSAFPAHTVQALELGNEPELYAVVPWYRRAGTKYVPWYAKKRGTPVLARRPGYSFAVFTGEFAKMRAHLPSFPLAGPSTGKFPWLAQLGSFLRSQPPLSLITFHRYGVNGCIQDVHSPHYPTIPNLLSTLASRGLMDGVSTYVAQAHAARAQFRIDEMNSVTCGGRYGVSNTFASSLWVMDTLFTMAADGVDGVNIHTFQDAPNALFDFTSDAAGKHWSGTVHPEYYGLLMFDRAAPAGSRLLHVAPVASRSLRVWSTRGADGKLRVLLINDSLTRSDQATVQVAGASGTGTLERLSAPAVGASTGVTLGGASFGAQTSTGELAPERTSSVAAVKGAYPVLLPAASAALLTLG